MDNLRMEHPNAFKFERQLVHRLYYDIKKKPKKVCLSQPKTAKLMVTYPLKKNIIIIIKTQNNSVYALYM